MRALPSYMYFSESEAGARLQRQYNEAIGEWGYFLRQHSCHGKSCADQIDLCLWGTMGTDHFLNPMPGMPSRIKYPRSYKMEGKRDPPSDSGLKLCFHDNLRKLKGSKTQLLSVKSSQYSGTLALDFINLTNTSLVEITQGTLRLR